MVEKSKYIKGGSKKWEKANVGALKDYREGKFKIFNSVIDLLKELRRRKR